MTAYEVTEYDDFDGAKLADAGKDRVLAALSNGYDAVVYTEQWVIDDKDFDRLSGAASLVGVDTIDAETDKAWLVIQNGTKAWVPKSVAELYRRGEGTVDATSSPQQFLDAYER